MDRGICLVFGKVRAGVLLEDDCLGEGSVRSLIDPCEVSAVLGHDG